MGLTKICSSCENIFEADKFEDFKQHFHADKSRSQGLSYVCKKCYNKRFLKPENGSIRSRKKYPKQYKARSVLNNAIAKGKIKKPENCVKCNSTGIIHGHHEDYSKPLDVIWLCPPCHSEVHYGRN